MGVAVNQEVIYNIAFDGEPIVGAVYDGKKVWQSAVNQIRFEPALVSLENIECQNEREFVVKSVMCWEIEELL